MGTGLAPRLSRMGWGYFLYPARVTVSAVFSSESRETARSLNRVDDFRSNAARYESWIEAELESQRATRMSRYDVAATEWSMFGFVFLLMTTEELVKAEPELLQDWTF